MRASLVSFLLITVAACTPAADPVEFGAQSLPGSDSRFTLIGGAFSISPGGKYLFGTNYDPFRHAVAPDGALRHAYVYDLETLTRHVPVVTAAAEAVLSDYGVLEESGCWQESRLFVRTPFPPRSLRLEATAGVWAWLVSEQTPCERTEASAGRLVDIRQAGDGSIQLWLNTRNSELARYAPVAVGGTAVIVEDLQVDPTGRWLAWRVTRPRGSFTGNSEAFLADLQSPMPEPQLLGSPVNFLRFAGDFLYGQYGQVSESDAPGRMWRIGRWRL